MMKVTGIEDLQQMLNERAPRVARNLMRATVQGIASSIAKDAKANAPVLTGNLKSAIKAKRSGRSKPDKPISLVTATSGKDKKHDAFYWRFVEYGTIHVPAHPFVEPAKKRAEANMSRLLKEEFCKRLEKQLIKEAKAAQ